MQLLTKFNRLCYNVNSMEDIYIKLKKELNALKENVALASFTSFNIGGPAKYFFIANENDEIVKAVKLCKKLNINFYILGNGTNILVSDKGFDGLVIKMENDSITFNNDIVVAESGVKVQKLIRESITNNLTGLEFLIGIPGTVGGGVAGNIGTATQWIDTRIINVTFINANNEMQTLPKSQCDFSYRYSKFKYNDKDIILSTELKLDKSDQNTIQGNVSNFLNNRSHQPVNKACAGSIFKNPKGETAWRLIDKLGLRGKKIGGAKVSNEHANFIINTGKATADDVVILISYIKQQVRDNLGIQLQEEIKYVGF